MGQEQEREQREQQRVRNYYSYLVIVKTRKSLIPLLVSLFVFLSFSGTHRDRFLVAWLFLSFLYLVLPKRKKKSCFFAQIFFQIFMKSKG